MNDETERAMVFDPISLSIGAAGLLICLGAITLNQSHTITAMIGLLVILVANTGILSYKVVIRGITRNAYGVWGTILVLYSILMAVGIIRALLFLLFNT